MSLFDTVCKTNIDLANRLRVVATDYKTLYVMGCFGAPMTQKNKDRYCTNHSYNKAADRTAMIKAASDDTFGFDCVCLIKGILWGWNGDVSRTYGGAGYAVNGVPDIGADAMINVCKDVSTDFSKIEVGEAVWMKGHIGVYVGDGLAVECTPAWENKVQLTACNKAISGYNRRNWTKHGKLPYIEYLAAPATPEEPKDEITTFNVLDVVKIRDGVTTYSNGKQMASWVPSSKLYVREVGTNTVVISTLKEGAVTGTVWAKDLVLVERNGASQEAPKETVSYPGTFSTGSEADQATMWEFLMTKFNNEFAVAGIMGNLYAESALRSNNLQQSYETKLGYTDASYTTAVDNGTYTNFVKDAAGYGLAQWTYWSRKQLLLEYAQEAKRSVGDFETQLNFLWHELESQYKSLVSKLQAATSVRQASDLMLHDFERPADQSEAVEIKRAEYSQKYYDKFRQVIDPPAPEVQPEPDPKPEVPPVEDTKEETQEVITPEDKNTLMKLIEAVVDFVIGLFKKSK